MALKNVLITVSSLGRDAGPFDIYDNFDTLIVSNVSRAELLAGYLVTVNDNVTSLKIQNDGVCINYEIVSIIEPTPTPTSTQTIFQFSTTNLFETPEEACAAQELITVTADSSFCNATTLSSSEFIFFGPGTFYIAKNGQVLQVNHLVGGDSQVTVTSSCSVCVTPTPTPTTTITNTPTTTPTRTPRPNCPNNVIVIQVCNSNSAKDDNFNVYLNGTYIGYLDLNQNSQIGSLFVGTPDTNVNVTEPDFICPLSGMTTYRFNEDVLIYGGTNVLYLENAQQNNNGNFGSVQIRNYVQVGNNLVQPCGVANLTYSGPTGANFTFNFDYNQCCEFTITPTPTNTPTNTQTPSNSPTPTQTPTNTASQTPTTTTTLTATPTQTQTNTQTSTPTNTTTQTPTTTTTLTATPTRTSTATPTQTPTTTTTLTATPTHTPTRTPTQTPTQTPTETPTSTLTPTQTPTTTTTLTASPTQTQTPTNTATQTNTPSPTKTPTQTPSHTPTNLPPEFAPNGFYYDSVGNRLYASTVTTKRVVFDGNKVGIDFFGTLNHTLTVDITDLGFKIIGLSEGSGQYVLVSDENGVLYYANEPGGNIDQNSFVSITGGTVVNNTWYYVGDNNSGSVEIVEIYNASSIINGNRIVDIGPYSLVFSGANINQFEIINLEVSGNTIETGSGSTINFSVDSEGNLLANSKSFVIKNIGKDGYNLRHGSVEGPENGVYFRGKTYDGIIELPEYWSWLVDNETVTVILTSYCGDEIYVDEITESAVIVGGNNCEFSYVIYGERKDIGKMDIEPIISVSV